MRIAVIGTGVLGPDIAQVFAQSNTIEKVYLCKGRKTSTRNGKDRIEKQLNKLVQREKLSFDRAKEVLDKIIPGEIENAGDADFLIEAVTEDLKIKQEVFSYLDKHCSSQCLFATNTSSLPIKAIGEGLSRPIIGMHFFNPAPVMKLVEIITTDLTPGDMVTRVVEMAKEIGKTPIEVKEAPGFVVNRVLIPMINEAISIYAEGIASVEDIDIAMKLGANQPMGPLALGDLIGLDVVLAILQVMLKETGDPKYVPQPLLKRMVRENKLGRKTGEGFYYYQESVKK